MQAELGMKEGFDVGLEMSGNPKALNDMIDNMAHGGRIALLGIMPAGVAVDWNKVVFNMLTIRGIYGREMYETWYKMTAMIQSGLDITPVITHRLPFTEFQQGFDLMRSGKSGKIVLELGASAVTPRRTRSTCSGSWPRSARPACTKRERVIADRRRARTSRSPAAHGCSTSAPTTTSASPTIRR